MQHANTVIENWTYMTPLHRTLFICAFWSIYFGYKAKCFFLLWLGLSDHEKSHIDPGINQLSIERQDLIPGENTP